MKTKTKTHPLSCESMQRRRTTKTKALAGLVRASTFFVIMTVLAMSAKGATVVDLGSAANFGILSQAGISTTAGTSIVGDIGVSPIASIGITGFGLILDPSGEYSTSASVAGRVFAPDYAAPTPAMLGVAIGDMNTAYTDAAGRSNPDFLNLLNGNLNGQTLVPGLYNWASGVTITDSITLDGGANSNAVWIFQISNRLTLANGADIFLSNGAMAQNIFWQTAEGATLGTNSHFEGILLTATDIAVQTGASVYGNLYAQTAVTLDANAITQIQSQVVPEPATWTLLIGSLVAAAALRRKHVGSSK